MVDHYDGTSEPLNSAEKKALQSDAAAYDALAARLAEADDNLLSVAIELGTTKARLAEAVECCTIKDNRNLWLEIRLQKVMARCADLLDEDQFNELDAMTRTTETVNGDSASAVQPERCCLDYPRCDCNSPPEPDNAPAVTGLTQQDYDALVRDAMLWRTRSPTGAGGNARAFVCCEGVGQHAPGCIAQEAAP